jgi:hypothetical protein
LNSNKLKTRCLEGGKPLKDLITMCRTAQIASQQATVMEGKAAGEVLSNEQNRGRRHRRLPNDVILRENVHAVVETSHIRTLVPPLVKSVMLAERKIIYNPCAGQ